MVGVIRDGWRDAPDCGGVVLVAVIRHAPACAGSACAACAACSACAAGSGCWMMIH